MGDHIRVCNLFLFLISMVSKSKLNKSGRLFLGLLLSTLETTIVSTALITIASDLGGYDKSNWIIVAYLLTYTGMLLQVIMVIFLDLSW